MGQTIDILPFLDEVQTVARNGLYYASSPYDRERYQKLLDAAAEVYGTLVEIPPPAIQAELSKELGYITPKVGADGAIFDSEGRILLVQRSDDKKYCLPCGWLDPNESSEEAVIREIREETGIQARVVQLVGVFSRKANTGHGPFSAVAIVYLCEVLEEALVLSHEVLDARYWAIDEVPVWHELHEQYARRAYEVWMARGESSMNGSSACVSADK